MKASWLEFLLHLGLAIATLWKNLLVYLTSRPISLPLKTLAMKFPPLPEDVKTRMAMLRADKTS